jgi:hypothetical protein
MDVYYDSEFIDTGGAIVPISIGFRRDDGEELYRIWESEITINQAGRNPWLRENVVSSLPVKLGSGNREGLWEFDRDHPDFGYVKRPHQIKTDITDFLLEAVVKGGDLTLWAWYAAYDHVLLAQIWGKMLDLPSWVPMNTCDLRQEHLRLGEPTLPRQKEGQHNALADARHDQVIHRFLKEYDSE